MEFIDLKAQYATHQGAIDARIRRVLDHGQYISGPEVEELESALAAYVGVTDAIAAGSGTVTLEIALRALGIGPGDEVVTVPFTWISSAEVIALVGATPVFVDIEPLTYNVDPAAIARAVTPRTKAIIAVNLFGQMADYDAIAAIAGRHGIPVIEDAAQSFGATRHGRRSGGVTRVGSTSFFPAKPLGCYGDGGALFTNDEDLARRMRAIRGHGGLRRHEHEYIGLNGRMDTLQAAVVLAKLPFFDEELAARERIARRYDDALAGVCSTSVVAEGNTHVYAQYTIRVPARDKVASRLKAAGIPTGVYYPKCLHEQPAFAPLGYRFGDFPASEAASRQVLSLPMHPYLAEADQDRVIAAVRTAVRDTAAAARPR